MRVVFDAMQSIGVMGVTIVIVVISVLLFFIVISFMGDKDKISKKKLADRMRAVPKDEKQSEGADLVAISNDIQSKDEFEELEKIPISKLHTGDIKCLCFHKIKRRKWLPGISVADFTVIPEPIGELYNFDPSCPLGGSGYIVKEEKGFIIDYDPRGVKFILKESPEYAWFAISWDIVKTVFFVPIQWWKSSSMWLAAGSLIVMFIIYLAVFGG